MSKHEDLDRKFNGHDVISVCGSYDCTELTSQGDYSRHLSIRKSGLHEY